MVGSIVILAADLLDKFLCSSSIIGQRDVADKKRFFHPTFGRLGFLDRAVFIRLNDRSFQVTEKNIKILPYFVKSLSSDL
ncbi:MAG: hypothetical protein A2Y94_13265 [Caldithrix sp. RBG_13_44_9]|nr:MAG: hypothetical protein A2Y94_13265 [Caldithrix sp. RBG_13_44_9]